MSSTNPWGEEITGDRAAPEDDGAVQMETGQSEDWANFSTDCPFDDNSFDNPSADGAKTEPFECNEPAITADPPASPPKEEQLEP